MAHIEVRAAREEDRDTVLAFCATTWEWGDYIEEVWDRWLHDPAGKLFVALVDGQPAGISHMLMLTPIDAWLEGLRVDPNYRQQGIAKALGDASIAEAMQRGATYARVMIHAENERSIAITERSHMRRVSSITFYHGSADIVAGQLSRSGAVQEHTTLASLDDLDDIIDYLNASNIFPTVGGLYYLHWTAQPITDELLREKIAGGHIYLLRRWERLDGLAIAEPEEHEDGPRLSMGYIDGLTIESISLIAYDLCRRLPEMQLESVRAYVPDLVLPRDAFSGIGYEWGESIFYTYERGLF